MLVIDVENLSKRYTLGQQRQERYLTLRDALANCVSRFGRRIIHPCASSLGPSDNAEQFEEFYALREVSFQVGQGERIGIIGRNGAGKSTLLKILSRITEPTVGRVRIRGRVASLLEVGTGFHPELTGRENIFLNGAILGMTRAEMRRRFDEIVAFAEVEKFLDTPVKRYSSGMYVRLAFAVAAHLEPEILIVDEVLAVGDAQFQKKCLGKMESVGKEGRTVLFVSHNMQAIKTLCQRGILLDKGLKVFEGTAEEVVARSLASNQLGYVGKRFLPEMHYVFPPDLEVYQLDLLNQHGEPSPSLMMGEFFFVRLLYRIHNPAQRYRIGIVFSTSDQIKMATVISTSGGASHIAGDQGQVYSVIVRLRNIFRSGNYTLGVHVKNSLNEMVDVVDNIPLQVLHLSTEDNLPSGGGLVWMEEEWQSPEIIQEEA